MLRKGSIVTRVFSYFMHEDEVLTTVNLSKIGIPFSPNFSSPLFLSILHYIYIGI